MKKLNLDKVKEMAGKVLPKKPDEAEAAAEQAAEAVEAVEAVEEAVEAAAEPAAPEEVTAEEIIPEEAAPAEAPVEETPAEAPAEKAEKPEKAPKKAAKQPAKSNKPAPAKQAPKAAKTKKSTKGAAPKEKFRISMPTADQLKNPAFIVPAAALLLLILAWCFTKKAAVSGVLGALSILASLYVLFPDIRRAVVSRDWRSGLLLLVLAAILYAVAGGFAGAAAALLLWLAGQKALDCLKAMKREQLAERSAASPLAGELPALADAPILGDAREHTLQSYFTILAIFLAAIVAVIAALTKAGYVGALRRAAVILTLGSTASFFAGFPFGDLSAVLTAADHGVLFRGASLSRLLGVKLCCVSEAEPEMFGQVAVYPTMPEKLNGETLVKLAALAHSRSKGLWAEQLASICETPAAEGLEVRELSGFGIAAKVNNLTVICGSAEFMNRAELPLVPFRDGAQVLHIGVNNFYAGCMVLVSPDPQEDTLNNALTECGLFRFADAAESDEKRQSGECVLFAAPDEKPEGCRAGDIFAVSGAYQAEADVVISRCGTSGLLDLTAQLRQAAKLRTLLVTLALLVKALLFLLALAGFCPLWLAVLLELALSAFGVYFGARARA